MKMQLFMTDIYSIRIDRIVLIFISIPIIASIAGFLGLLSPAIAVAWSTEGITADIVNDATNFNDQSYPLNPIKVNLGDTVLWTSNDSTHHTVTKRNSKETNNIIGEQYRNDEEIVESIISEIIANVVKIQKKSHRNQRRWSIIGR